MTIKSNDDGGEQAEICGVKWKKLELMQEVTRVMQVV